MIDRARFSRQCWMIACASVLLSVGACQQREQSDLEKLKEKTAKGSKLMPVGGSNQLLLPELQAKAKEHPDDFKVQYELGLRELDARDFEAAMDAATKALQLDPASIPAMELLTCQDQEQTVYSIGSHARRRNSGQTPVWIRSFGETGKWSS